MTTKETISTWFDVGVKEGYSHLIVMTDTFDYEDYPMFAYNEDHCREILEDYKKGSMQRVMEVYDLRQDRDEQLNEHRCWSAP